MQTAIPLAHPRRVDPVSRELASDPEILLVGRTDVVAAGLTAYGVEFVAVRDFSAAVAALSATLFRVVVVASSVEGYDGVTFVVSMRGSRWADVTFVVLPDPGGSEFVIRRGGADPVTRSTKVVALTTAIVSFLRPL